MELPARSVRLLGTTLVVLAGSGCATQSGLGEGAFHKRRAHPAGHAPATAPATGRTEQAPASDEATDPFDPSGPLASISPTAPLLEPAPAIDPAIRSGTTPGQDQGADHTVDRIHADAPPPEVQREEVPPRWNPWAVPAFSVALATVAYAILGTSAWIAVVGIILTLVLAGVAVKRGRMNEWRGKGFAVSALVIGTLAALITLIALVGGG